MNKLLLAVFIVCLFVTAGVAQRPRNVRSKVLLDANKPAVFLSFLRLTKIKPDDLTDDPNNIFFQLTNNTRWSIMLDMSGVSKKEYGDASLYYAIEDKQNGTVQKGSTDCHVCSVNPLKSGKSIIFSLPLNEASRDTRMRIAYSFDWEYENESEGSSYSKHSIEFYFNGLPKSILPE